MERLEVEEVSRGRDLKGIAMNRKKKSMGVAGILIDFPRESSWQGD
jgi:hypothetical protein